MLEELQFVVTQKMSPASWENQQCGFRTEVRHKPGCTLHRRWLETGNFGFRKQRNCTIHVAKTKALITELRGYREADLRLCFRICRLLVFS